MLEWAGCLAILMMAIMFGAWLRGNPVVRIMTRQERWRRRKERAREKKL